MSPIACTGRETRHMLPPRLSPQRQPKPTILPPRAVGMTVCVVAMCEDRMIVGASDRMVTAGDTEFQPEAMKGGQLTETSAFLWAGNASLQGEVFTGIRPTIAANPTMTVHEIAHAYQRSYGDVRMRRAEAQYLSRLGLTWESFLAGQNRLDRGLVRRVEETLSAAPWMGDDGVATIFAGCEPEPHIYLCSNDEVHSLDNIGFVAIGTGARHAESHFMLEGHTRKSSIFQTLYRTYVAKKHAEAAPGVGQQTDMFAVGPGGYLQIAEIAIRVFERTRGNVEIATDGLKHEAWEATKKLLESVEQEKEPTEQTKAATPKS